ncbi:MAG: formyl-CoA transferase [Gammaproteobacteria bacterium]|nr:formyl-CoA transferase [Gammaproteobacteria bacterium]
MNGPLQHLRVLDLTIARAGPTAVRLLADWGAEVIKIEPPPRKDGKGNSVTGGRRGPDEQNLHRNKRSLAINLKKPDGQELFHDLVKQADVIVENFRSDVKYRLSVDYETVKKIKPDIIYASISGFGQDGPYATRPGVDQIIQGMSGLMSVTGEPGRGPMRVGVAISDTSAGMFLGQGILLALLHRERTGEGQWVHTSLLESMMSKLDFQGARYTMKGEVADQQGNDHPTQVPMGTFEAKDGFVNIAAFGDVMWKRFCDALGAKELFDDPDYQTVRDRSSRHNRIKEDMNKVTSQRTVSDLVGVLNEAGVPTGPINNIGEGFEDAQVKHLKLAKPAPHAELGDLNLVRSPINLSQFPQSESFDNAAPDPGANSVEVLEQLGFDQLRISKLQEEGVIG